MLEEGKQVEILWLEEGWLRVRVLAPEVVHKMTPVQMHAKEPIVGEERIVEFPRGFRVYLLDDTGQLEAFLRADYGYLLPSARKLVAQGRVVLLNHKQERLDAMELVIDGKKQKIYSERHIRIRRENMVLEGEGFVSDLTFQRYTIRKIRGTVPIPPDLQIP